MRINFPVKIAEWGFPLIKFIRDFLIGTFILPFTVCLAVGPFIIAEHFHNLWWISLYFPYFGLYKAINGLSDD